MLKNIVKLRRQEVEMQKGIQPVKSFVGSLKPAKHEFYAAFAAGDWGLIAECKLASPAKGMLCSNYSVPELAAIFSENGAKALSIHTSSPFKGEIADIGRVSAVSNLPILRKDFIIDPYQIYEARAHGAQAILLIAAILTDAEIKDFAALADELGMDSLVEVHDLAELNRVQKNDLLRIIGINNRDLNTFRTDIETTFKLLKHCDSQRMIISESGIKDGNDARRLAAEGVKGVLVGEGLVTAADIACKTQELALISGKIKEDK